MWHRFSVLFAVIAVGGVYGVGSLAQPGPTRFTPAAEAPELGAETVATTYVQRNRRGTGRRGRLS
ncbi:hypothetical protein [Leptolyngbya sp. KIOST-1]|uniref:hypothetical protein n=1 Tax=Leptolyngbya sp. KIOST-1 TaxID=1229172 RepID=UPI0012E01063|nr:hypothetical protein [Leptolyngbya sp. KIOST-1]